MKPNFFEILYVLVRQCFMGAHVLPPCLLVEGKKLPLRRPARNHMPSHDS